MLVELPGLAEPVGLRARVASEPDAVRAEIASGTLIITPLWKAWGPALAAQGLDRAALSAILRGYGYELWLWGIGERTWAQSLEGLGGRVSRRVGARAPAKTARTASKAKKARKATQARPATKTQKTKKATNAGRPTKAAKAGRASKTAKSAKTANSAKTAKSAKSAKTAKTAKSAKTTRAAGSARKTRRR
jgi:hypothetical protein